MRRSAFLFAILYFLLILKYLQDAISFCNMITVCMAMRAYVGFSYIAASFILIHIFTIFTSLS